MPATTDIRPFSKDVLCRPDWLAAFAISGLIIWLHIYFLMHAGGFWRDEVNLINLAGRNSLNEMSKDSFPILMPLLVRVWSTIGFAQNDFNLRLLGTFIGLGLPAALWFAAWKIKRSPPLLGLSLLALNSTLIQFGDSLRAYGLGSLLIVLTTAAAWLFLEKPSWKRAGIFAALAILSAQALYQNAVFIAAICFGAWTVCAREKNFQAASKILFVAAISAASLLPYWSHVASMPDAAAALRNGFNPRLVFVKFDSAAGFPLEQYLRVWEFFALAVVICGCASFFPRRKISGEKARPGKFAFAHWTVFFAALAGSFGFLWFAAMPAKRWYFMPLVFLAVAWLDLSRRFSSATANAGPQTPVESGDGTQGKNLPLFAGTTLLVATAGFAGFLWFAALGTEPWYFLTLMALAAACFEIGLPVGRHLRAAIFGFAVLTAIISVPFERQDLSSRFTNLDLLAPKLAAEAAPEDFIIVSPWYCGISFERYFKGETPWNTLPPLKDHSMHRFDLVREQMQTLHPMQPMFDKIAATLRAGHRVWFVSTTDIPAPGIPMDPDLPPPPLKFSGWSDRPYNQLWTPQVAQFLSDHSRHFAQVYYTTNQSINYTENLFLDAADGWRDNPPTNNLQK
jgi:hypothetical protein